MLNRVKFTPREHDVCSICRRRSANPLSALPQVDGEDWGDRQQPDDEDDEQPSRERFSDDNEDNAERSSEDNYYDRQRDEPTIRGENKAVKAQRKKMDYHQQQQRRKSHRLPGKSEGTGAAFS